MRSPLAPLHARTGSICGVLPWQQLLRGAASAAQLRVRGGVGLSGWSAVHRLHGAGEDDVQRGARTGGPRGARCCAARRPGA